MKISTEALPQDGKSALATMALLGMMSARRGAGPYITRHSGSTRHALRIAKDGFLTMPSLATERVKGPLHDDLMFLTRPPEELRGQKLTFTGDNRTAIWPELAERLQYHPDMKSALESLALREYLLEQQMTARERRRRGFGELVPEGEEQAMRRLMLPEGAKHYHETKLFDLLPLDQTAVLVNRDVVDHARKRMAVHKHMEALGIPDVFPDFVGERRQQNEAIRALREAGAFVYPYGKHEDLTTFEDAVEASGMAHEDAKGGEATGNPLATDELPESIFGIPVVGDESRYTEADIAFFRKHPEAGGYYDLGEGTPEDGSEEGAPVQDDGPATFFQLNGNLKTEGRPRYLFRDDEGKVTGYGTQLSTVARDDDGTWVAIPTIIEGREPLSAGAAFEHYKRTGEFFHRGATEAEAKAGADAAHVMSQAQDMAWWNNYIADHLSDGTLSTTDRDMAKVVSDPGFLRWASGQEEGAYKRTPGESDAALRVERRRRAILDGRIEPNAIDRKAMPPRDLERARDARKRYLDSERAGTGPSARRADTKGGSAYPVPIKKGPLHYGPPPPPERGAYPGSWNNPGNIQKGEVEYDGEAGSVKSAVSSGTFLKFRTPQDGLNAKAQAIGQIVREKIPRRYGEGRLPSADFTVSNLVKVYAPPEDGNDTDGYIGFVADRMGVDKDRVLDMDDARTMSSLLDAIIRRDSGHPHADWFTATEREAAARKMKVSARPRSKPKTEVKNVHAE